MRVICCYTEIEERSAKALALYAPDAELINVSNSIYDYGEAIASRWNAESDLVIIEHDNVITADVLPSFEQCSGDWCSYSYYIYPDKHSRKLSTGLGCTRFSVKVQQAIPTSAFICSDDPEWNKCLKCYGAGCWQTLDIKMERALQLAGFDIHNHGTIEHYHDYSNLVCKDAVDVMIAQSNLAKSVTRNHDQYPNDELAGPMWQR